MAYRLIGNSSRYFTSADIGELIGAIVRVRFRHVLFNSLENSIGYILSHGGADPAERQLVLLKNPDFRIVLGGAAETTICDQAAIESVWPPAEDVTEDWIDLTVNMSTGAYTFTRPAGNIVPPGTVPVGTGFLEGMLLFIGNRGATDTPGDTTGHSYEMDNFGFEGVEIYVDWGEGEEPLRNFTMPASGTSIPESVESANGTLHNSVPLDFEEFDLPAASAAPDITSIGTLRVGSQFTINLEEGATGTTSVTVGGKSVGFTVVNDGQIIGTAPGAGAGNGVAVFDSSVNVVVTNSQGSDSVAATWLGPDGYSKVVLGTIDDESHIGGDPELSEVDAADVCLFLPIAVNESTGAEVPFSVSVDGFFNIQPGSPPGLYRIYIAWQKADADYAYTAPVEQYIQFNTGGAAAGNPVFQPAGPLEYFDANGDKQTLASENGVKVAVFSQGGVFSGNRLYSGTFNIPASGLLPVIDSDLLGEVGDAIEVFYQTADGRREIAITGTVTDGDL